MQNIIIIGASGHAKVVIDNIEKELKYNIIGLVDPLLRNGSEFFGYKILGKDEDLPVIIKKYNIFGGIIAIGDNWKRYLVYRKMCELIPHFNFVNAIHPASQIARGGYIDIGTIIMAGAIINSDVKIGPFCILNTNSSIDHDSIMEEFSSLAPNSSIGGNVTIGSFSAISLGANIIHEISIGEHTVIGAGSTVIKDIPDYVVAYGTPAEVVRKREKGEKYL